MPGESTPAPWSSVRGAFHTADSSGNSVHSSRRPLFFGEQDTRRSAPPIHRAGASQGCAEYSRRRTSNPGAAGPVGRTEPSPGNPTPLPASPPHRLCREADRQLSVRSGDRILGEHGDGFASRSRLLHPSNARHIARLSSPGGACCVGAEIELLERGKRPGQPNGGGENQQEWSQGDPEQEQQHPPAATRKPHRAAHGWPPFCPSWASWT